MAGDGRGEGQVLLGRVVGEQDGGRRADAVLAGWLGEPRARTQQRFAAGQVRADGAAIAKSYRLRPGERVEVAARPVPPADPAPPPVPVRYADEHLLVVAKPAGLVVHRGAGTRGPTLVDALLAAGETLAPPAPGGRGAGAPAGGGGPGDGGAGVPGGGRAGPTSEADRPGIVHRLDRGTSGLLAVARTAAAAEGLRGLLRRREVERRYWALAEGTPEPRRATIDAPVARHPTRRARFAVVEGGRRAVTHYDVVAVRGPAAELDVRLETGRTHQVRVHLSAVGHPLVGDRLYGASALGERLGLDRPALHARRLAFEHPVTGERVDVEEPLPDDLRQALARLG